MNKILTFLFLVLTFPIYAQSSSPWPQQMSADQAINFPDGKSVTSKIYVDNGKVRIDIHAEGLLMSSIVLIDNRTMYTMSPTPAH